MKKIYYFLGWLLLFAVQADAQFYTLQPTFPLANAPLTITVDLRQAADPRAKALLGKTDDIYLWAWGGSDAGNRTAEFGPAGQTAFSQPFAPGKMTSLGNDRWQITLTPATYLSIPAGKTLRWLGFLVKNGSGTAQTEDVTVLLYENKLNAAIVTPSQRSFFVEAGATLPVRAVASRRATLTLTLNGQAVATAQDSVLNASVNVGSTPGQVSTLRLTATLGTESVTDEITFTIRPVAEVADVPAGTRDGLTVHGPASATLTLFAPNKQFVYLLGDFNNWTPSADALMKRTPDGQRYWLTLNGLDGSKAYAYQFWVDGTVAVADPYATKILDKSADASLPATVYPGPTPFPAAAKSNIVSVLQTAPTPYTWRVPNFQRPAQTQLVIYELLMRDFVGTEHFQTLSDTLAYLKRLGVNAIELMPIMEFSGNDSWGYNPTFFLAPDKAYGTAASLKNLIDRCHENGMAVILDMVLNHADYEFPYVKMYWDGSRPSADNPMFNPADRHPFGVFFDFNHEAPATQAYVKRVVEYWLQEFKFDGYRFDLSKGFTQQPSTDDGQFRRYDASRIATWKRIYGQIRAIDPTAYVILEHFAEDREEQELAAAGMMLWANLNGEFREAIKNGGGDFSRLYHLNHGFTQPHAVGYAESHDEERLMYDALANGSASGSYNVKDLPTALSRSKALAAFLLLVPGPKMLWQFQELGYDVSINENGRVGRKPFRWAYQNQPERQKLYQTYAALIALRKQASIAEATALTGIFSGQVRSYRLTGRDFNTVLVGNLGLTPADWGGLSDAGSWYDFFTGKEVSTLQKTMLLAPGQFHVFTSKKQNVPAAGLVSWDPATPLVTGLEPAAAGLQLYPLPAHNALQVRWPLGGRATLRLLNAKGQLVLEKQTEKNRDRLDVSALPPGLYVLQVQAPGQVYRTKFVKQ